MKTTVLLLPCYKINCSHPACAKGKPDVEAKWYDGGPPLSYLPIPIPDSGKAWGSDCERCIGTCAGHYLSPANNVKLIQVNSGNGSCIQPPSVTIRKFLGKKEVVTDDEIKNLSTITLLKMTEVKMWIDHLLCIRKRRKHGASKAAEMRKAKMLQAKKGNHLQWLHVYTSDINCTIIIGN